MPTHAPGYLARWPPAPQRVSPAPFAPRSEVTGEYDAAVEEVRNDVAFWACGHVRVLGRARAVPSLDSSCWPPPVIFTNHNVRRASYRSHRAI